MRVQRLRAVPLRHWIVVAFMLLMPIISVAGFMGGGIAPTVSNYILQPAIAVAGAGLAYVLLGPGRNRARHQSEKAFMVAAVLALWFVVYFLSGLVLTYVRNSLVTGFWPVVLNVAAFGVTALAVEYVRYLLLANVSRRLIIPFGIIVSVLFAFIIMPINQLTTVTTLEVGIKVFTATILPAFASSLLLTYLAIVAGLPSMLTYRLGIVAIGLLPPIIPNYDWYLIGISSLVVVVIIYLVIDRTLQEQSSRMRRHTKQLKRVSDAMYIIVLVALVSFMTGVFSYKPLAIVSNSMQPVYSRGSIVVVEKVSEQIDIGVGDIVQYESEGKTITHRVVSVNAARDGSGKRVYTTKGDNSPSTDPIIAANQITGVVKAQIPYLGYPTIWLRELAR